MPLHAEFLFPNEEPCLQDWIFQHPLYIATSAEMQRPRGGYSRNHRANAAKEMQMTACRNRTAGKWIGRDGNQQLGTCDTDRFSSHKQYSFNLGITSKTTTGSQKCLMWMPKHKSCKFNLTGLRIMGQKLHPDNPPVAPPYMSCLSTGTPTAHLTVDWRVI